MSSNSVENNSVQTSVQQPGSNRPLGRVFPGFKLVSGIASSSIVLGLLTLAAPPASALTDSPLEILKVIPRNRFDNCTAALVRLEIAPQEAATACATALEPGNLSKCVQRVSGGRAIAPAEALSACRQVRQPEEMAECFTDIRRQVTGAAANEVLDNCRRTILPERFSNCVQGVSKSVNLTPTEVMNTCIGVRDVVTEFDPTFIPYTTPPAETLPPSTPPAETPLTTPGTPLTPAAPTPTPTAPSPAEEVTPQRY